MALVALVTVVLISLAVHCYTKADEKLKKRIMRFNGGICAIFIILLFLSIHQDMKMEKYLDEYDIYTGGLGSWTYEGSDKEYYYIHESGFLGSSYNYAVPRSSCKLSPIARIGGKLGIKVFTLPNTFFVSNTIEIEDSHYDLADSVIMIEPDYYYLFLYYAIIAVIILLIYNSVTLLTINDQNDSQAEQSDSKAEQNDNKAEQSDSQAEQSDSQAEQSDSEAEQNDSKVEQNDSKVEQNSSEANPPVKK